MTRRLWALVVVVALVAGAYAVRSNSNAVTVATIQSVPDVATPTLTWANCSGTNAPAAPFQCATLKAPLNYREPSGATVSVALVRLPATKSKRGIILANPGGPGASGFDFIAGEGRSIVSTLSLDNYDLVGFDPRGVDRSGGLKCQTDAEVDKYLYVDDTPDTPAEKKLYDDSKTAFERACEKKYGSALANYSTEFTARDMDLIRRAMGADTLNYIGVSYGTYLGGVYATLFPDTTGRLYLDGAFDPAGDTVDQQYTTQAQGFEKAFDNWSKDCQSDTECAFHATDVGARWDALLDTLDKTSIKSDSGREVNNAVMETATTQALYAKSLWGSLSSALAAAEKGDGTALLRLADSYNDRRDDGTFSSLMQSFAIIRCASGIGSKPPKNPKSLVAKLKKIAPRMAKDVTVDDFSRRECDGLMADPPAIAINYSGEAPIVVVGGKNDPATPFRWSEKMAEHLGTNARLVAYTGEGHGQILNSKCVDGISRALFSSASTLPKAGTVCEPDPPVRRPAWWTSIPAASSRDTVISRDKGDGYVGVTDTQVWAEYRAVRGARRTVYAGVKKGLVAGGFVPADPKAVDTDKSPQYFTKSREYLGVLVIDAADVSKDGFAAPAGPIPAGDSLVVFFYFPPDQ